MSRRDKARESRAFTIPELLLGVIIFTLVVTVAINAYATISQLWKESLVMNELSLSANTAIERMIHGNSANTGLLAAKDIIAPTLGLSANSVVYTVPFDAPGVERGFNYSVGKIYTEDNKSIISNIDEAAIASSNIFFNIDDRVIEIVLNLKKNAGSKEVKLRVKTKVRLRN